MSVLANTAILAFDRYRLSDDELQTLEMTNIIFFSIFVCEMFIKLLSLGFHHYFLDRYNILDFVIVVISTIDVALT